MPHSGLGRMFVALGGSWASLLITVHLRQLEEVQEQLQVTRGHLNVTKGYVSWQMEEELRQVVPPGAWGGDWGLPGREEGDSEFSEALVHPQNTQSPSVHLTAASPG